MTTFVDVTEWIRFNDDGSSDHLRVIGSELVESVHYERSPYVRLDQSIAWAVHVHPELAGLGRVESSP